MKEYYLDFKLSKKIYNSNKNKLKKSECYNNIFNIITTPELVNKDIKIAYGFIYRTDINMFTRHCFILLNNKVVDPTVLFWSVTNVQNIVIYYPFKIYSFDEYLSALSKKANRTDLYELLIKEEIHAHNKLISMNFTRNLLEVGEFLQRAYKENLWEGIENYNKNNKLIIKK